MARILYGVQGNGRGHAIRALTIARRFPRHEFLFLTHTDALSVLAGEFRTLECPNPVTPVRSHRVASLELASSNLRFLAGWNRVQASVLRIADAFRPDAGISDYEHFVPVVCKQLKIPCLSIDHQHIVSFWSHHVPASQLPSYFGAYVAARFLFSNASHYLVVSFFRPPRMRGKPPAKLVPPLLRNAVLSTEPRDEDHVLAYQSTSTFERFLPFLRDSGRRVLVYGLESDQTDGNLVFRRFSEEGFLNDLASSSYVVCGGGHTLISEALFFGKPVMSFPIGNIFEQFLNAQYVEKLGYGMNVSGLSPGRSTQSAFEANLDRYRENIRKSTFCGNEEIFSILEEFIGGQGREREMGPVFRERFR